MRNHDPNVALMSLLVPLAAALSAKPVQACTPGAPPVALVGVPKDGAIDVPTDVRPVFYGPTATLSEEDLPSSRFELTPDRGPRIQAVARRSHVWHFEVVPKSPLAPRTRYTLSGRWRGVSSLSLSFTTGDGPLRTLPLPPAVSLHHYTLENAQIPACTILPYGTCVAAPKDTMVEHITLDRTGREDTTLDDLRAVHLFDQPFMTNLTGINQGNPAVCMKMRTRADNGALSEPVVVCAADAPRYALRDSANLDCTASGLVHEGRLVRPTPPDPPITPGPAPVGGSALPPPAAPPAQTSSAPPAAPPDTSSATRMDGGCSMAARTSSTNAVWLTLLVAAALHRLRRSRSGRLRR